MGRCGAVLAAAWAAPAAALGSGAGLGTELRDRGGLLLPGGEGEVGVAVNLAPFRSVWIRSRMPYPARPVFLPALLPFSVVTITVRVLRWRGHADRTWSLELTLAVPWCHYHATALDNYGADVPYMLLSPGQRLAPVEGGVVEVASAAAAVTAPGEGSADRREAASAALQRDEPVVLAAVQTYDGTQAALLTKSASACSAPTPVPVQPHCEDANSANLGYAWQAVRAAPMPAFALHAQLADGLRGSVREDLGYAFIHRGTRSFNATTDSGPQLVRMAAGVAQSAAGAAEWEHLLGAARWVFGLAQAAAGAWQPQLLRSPSGVRIALGRSGCGGDAMFPPHNVTLGLTIISWDGPTATPPLPTGTRTATPTASSTTPQTATLSARALCGRGAGGASVLCSEGEQRPTAPLWLWLLLPLSLVGPCAGALAAICVSRSHHAAAHRRASSARSSPPAAQRAEEVPQLVFPDASHLTISIKKCGTVDGEPAAQMVCF
eukprot:TRINITY_DN19126_c0_g1_i1.p1 TRINITY_DN19126_c0_g1~~TRINITY_DN19126_c0_g1_i1.p1  ORF type:complete len:492 (+),score=59.50 TRINITY_DN19126_c0_g1_i1:72-1547(+)